MSTENPQHSLSRVSFPKSERKSHPGATAAGKTDPQQIISVSVIVKRKNALNLEALGGRHLSQEEFAEKYAADPANFDHLRDFAHKNGLTVDEAASSLARRTIVLRGPANKIEAAFGVNLSNYQHEGKQFHSYTGMISMAQEHAEPVEAVLGLDTHPIAKPHIRLLDNAVQNKKKKKSSQPTPFNPPAVAELYQFPTGVNGSGQTIGIIELGGGYFASDLSTYFRGLNIPEPRVTAISVDGGTNAPGPVKNPNDADGEVALDIEVAGAVAPGANIAVYFTTNTSQGFIDALTTALHDTANGPPSVISISWGSAESNWTEQSMLAFDEAAQSAAALGITITVASGDNGSTDGVTTGGQHVDFPASSPHVLGCGGTALIGSGKKITAEVVWDDLAEGGGACGGGVSSVFALPTYQSNVKVPKAPTKTGGRGVPDVAGDASPETGYNILYAGKPQVVGGTSAVAPLWAALIALLNQQRGSAIGFANPTLYAKAEDGFHDITQGNNGAYSAGTGWDPCTGLGSPDGTELSQIFAASGSAKAPAHKKHAAHAGD